MQGRENESPEPQGDSNDALLGDIERATTKWRSLADSIREPGPSALLTAIEERIEKITNQFLDPSGELERKAKTKRDIVEKILEVVDTGDPQELIGRYTDFHGEGRDIKPYVAIGNPRQLMQIQPEEYGVLVEYVRSELGIEKDAKPVVSGLTQDEKAELSNAWMSNPQYGLLLSGGMEIGVEANAIVVERVPSPRLPGYVLQRATSTHPRMEGIEVYSFARVKPTLPSAET